MKRKWGWMVLHAAIILNLLLQIGYSGFKCLTFPDGRLRVLFGEAQTMEFQDMVTRRLYAIETWVAIAGLSVYLAVTEIAPRFWPRNKTDR